MTGKRDRKNLVCVGAVSGVHGVRGVLTIRPFTEHPEDIAAYGPVHTKDGKRTFSLKIIGSKKGVLLARIDGITDRTAAEALKGLELYVDRTVLPEPELESWYQADLIGLAVRDMVGNDLGKINAIQNYGAGDLLEIRLRDSNQTVLLPFTREVVPTVDVGNGCVHVDLPEGALD